VEGPAVSIAEYFTKNNLPAGLRPAGNWKNFFMLLIQNCNQDDTFVIPACPESFFVFRRIPDSLRLRE